MWRFAIVTRQSTSLNLHKISYSNFAAKLKTTSFFRCLSNETAALRLEQEQPIREIFSLDDFGLLPLTRTSSFESTSTLENDRTFIEQLLRYDTLANLQIPTTVDPKELGGSNEVEVIGFDEALELLAEGVDAELIADELTEYQKSYHDEQQPSTSHSEFHHTKKSDENDEEIYALPFLMPKVENEGPKTRKLLTERIRRERKLNLSTTTGVEAEPESIHSESDMPLFHASTSSPTSTDVEQQNIGEMMFPESLSVESYSSNWGNIVKPHEEQKYQSEAIEKREEKFIEELSLEVLEGMMSNGDIDQLLTELKAATWPEYLFTDDRNVTNRVNRIFRCLLTKSDDFVETEEIVRKFASTHPLATIPDDVIVRLAAGLAGDEPAKVLKKLEDLAKLCTSREVRPNVLLVNEALQSLYDTILMQGKKDLAKKLFSKCLKLNFERSAEQFLKCFADSCLASNSSSFDTDFGSWKVISTKFGSSSGVGSYWIMALNGEKMNDRIAELLAHSMKMDHPFTTMAWLICGFVKLNEMEKAIEVFRTVSVSGRHFRAPLMSFLAKSDLESIEKLGELIERGMIAEKRRGGKKKEGSGNVEEKSNETPKLLDEKFYEVLAKFYGTGGQKKKVKFNQKLKKKIHKVDDQQMHELCDNIQRAWIQCAVKKQDKESAKRLTEWCQRNRIEMDAKVLPKISKFDNLEEQES